MPADFKQGFVVREPAWHGLATVLAEYPGRDEAMRIAGHDFEVIPHPLFLGRSDVPHLVALGRSDGPHLVETHQGIVRSDTEALLGVVGYGYVPVQNRVAWDVVDVLADQQGVQYESGGILREGATLWVLAKVDEPSFIQGDDSPVQCYLAGSWSHDGSGAFRVARTSVRIVCSNTHDAAMNEASRTGLEYTFRHTRNVMARIEQARAALSGIRASHQLFIEMAEELIQESVTLDQIDRFISEFVPQPSAAVTSERVQGNIDKARQQVRNLLGGATIPEQIASTKWGLLQAGVEYLDHERAYRSQESYLGRSIRPEPRKHQLLKLVRGL